MDETTRQTYQKKSRGAEDGESVVTQPISVLRPRFGLFVDGVVRGTKCRFLVDSESTDTLISCSVFQGNLCRHKMCWHTGHGFLVTYMLELRFPKPRVEVEW